MRAAVVGAGIGGLTAARDLVSAGYDVVVLEASGEVGGKLRRAEVAGVGVDVGTEAMLHRRPEGTALAAELGLEVVHPTRASSRIWTRGALRPLPRSLMGVPLDLDDLAASGVLSPEGLARAGVERVEPWDGEDTSVGDLVAARFGDEVVDRLVEPLLGGVYAGRARDISARAAAPQLVALADRGPILAQGASLPVDPRPVFAGLATGMGSLVEALADGAEIRTGLQVRQVERRGDGYVLVVARHSDEGPRAQQRIEADAVVLATPAAPTSRLLTELAPRASVLLGEVEHASMAVVTLALARADVPGLVETYASGFLVPPVDGRAIKASTFSFAKWDWVRDAGEAEGVAHLRTSLGRLGEEAALQAGDDELVARSLRDLADAVDLRATPVATHVQRWGGGLPQYRPGHLDRVVAIREDVARVPGLALCGAAYDGVGLAAVIGSARRAAASLG